MVKNIHKKLLLALTCSALVLLPAASGFANSTSGPTIGSTVDAVEQGVSSTISNVTGIVDNIDALASDPGLNDALGSISFSGDFSSLNDLSGNAKLTAIRDAVSTYGSEIVGASGEIADTVQFVRSLNTDTIANYATNLAVNEGTALLTSIAPQEAGLVLAAIDNPTQGAALALEYSGLLTGEQAGVVGQVLGGNPAAALPFLAQELGVDLGGVDVGQLVNDPVGYATDMAIDFASEFGQDLATDFLGQLGGEAFGAFGGDVVTDLLNGDLSAQGIATTAINALAEGALPGAAANLLSNIDDPAAAATALASLSPQATAALDSVAQAVGLEGAADLVGAGTEVGNAAAALDVTGVFCPCIAPLAFAAAVLHPGTDFWITTGFNYHQTWLIETMFNQYILPAYMMMTEQLTVAMMQQVNMFGQFLDAKHQLETQRLFQQLQAQAHKDYHPSEGLCQIGTNVRSLASSDRSVEFNTTVISNRTMQRQIIAGDALSLDSDSSDRLSRLEQFKNTYCNPLDNAMGLQVLCGAGGPADRQNKDIDFTRTFDSPMTLELDFTDEGAGPPTADEEDVFALAAYLYGHKTPSQVPESFLTDSEGAQLDQATSAFLGTRSVIAKRSVAQNSYAAIMAQKSQGAPEVQPFMYAMLEDMGLPEDEINEILGDRPSYHAQMEMLTKKLYQHPNFYTELYDKPANVQRKQVAMQAIELMQKRDMFRSLLRSEMALSVLLETAISTEQAKMTNEGESLGQEGVSNE